MRFRLLNAIVAIAIALSMIAPAVAAPLPGAPGQPAPGGTPVLTEGLPTKAGVHTTPAAKVYGETDPGSAQPAVYIVQLQGAPIAGYRGGVADLAATSPAVTGSALDLGRAADRAYAAYLSGRQAEALRTIEQALGRPVEVKFTYQAALNGFALVLTPKEAVQVVNLPGVLRVQRDFMDQPRLTMARRGSMPPPCGTAQASPPRMARASSSACSTPASTSRAHRSPG